MSDRRQDGPQAAVLRTRPGAAFVVLYRPALLIPAVLLLASAWAIGLLPTSAGVAGWSGLLVWLAAAWVVAYAAWGVLEWLSRRYELTAERVNVAAGVVRRVAADVPLRNVQHVTMAQSVLERVLGLGTIGIATAGSDGAAVRWLMVARPGELLGRVSRSVDAAQGRAPGGSRGRAADRPVVIGLAGAIGSGKSEVARILAGMGWLVSDSDAEAKAALERPEVRDRLVEWWGKGVLGAGGRVDRGAVARIVFSDPVQRARLEGLVHPLVKASREQVMRRAREQGRGLVIDAPLLFEAGVDAECDAVIFIDTPRDVRLERVKATRGWDEAEVSRREAAQLPVEEKRRRSHEVVINAGDHETLEAATRAALERLLARVKKGTQGVASGLPGC